MDYWVDVAKIVGPIVTLLGILLGAVKFYDSKLRRKVRIESKITNGMVTFTDGNCSEAQIIITAYNHGEIPVTLNYPFLKVKDLPGSTVLPHFQFIDRFPYVLQAGQSVQAFTEIKALALVLKKQGLSGDSEIIAGFRTQLDREIPAKKNYLLDIDGWTKDN